MKRIDVLPDDVLLRIFDFYMIIRPSYGEKKEIEAWQSLVHVCRRWRSLVLGSKRRLKLRLLCSPGTPVRDTLDVWPTLPLIIQGYMPSTSGTDNIIAALGQSNRVCRVDLEGLAGRQLRKALAAMQVPFPKLTELRLFSDSKTLPVIPDSFLNGSAPHLRIFGLGGIPFPGLPKLLLSATHLVDLQLFNIPDSGYISPEAMAALLSASSSLRMLCLEFKSSLLSRPGWESRRSIPPPKRSILPALQEIYFSGVTEYLEGLVTRIDTPQLNVMHIMLPNSIYFDCPRLAQFINRTPTLRALDKAHVNLGDQTVKVVLLGRSRTPEIEISSFSWREHDPDWQLSSVAQICNSSLPFPSPVEDLSIGHEYLQRVWKNDAIENTHWVQLLLPFTAVKKLCLPKKYAPGVAAALKELVGSRITEVLPSLQSISVEGLKPTGPLQKNFAQFAAARQLSGHPVAISAWH
jgi:hypothetical protein